MLWVPLRAWPEISRLDIRSCARRVNMKWEYAVKDYHGPLHHQLPVRVSVKADEIEKALNQLGTDGWELVSVNPLGRR